ncbi:MAG: type II toxin-antitoxin system HicB family antitoxin [Anaerolineae bacterium]|nr:type II toxin-antitoxin system HicB family antitoxin [Anaerolineae bacterium]
MTKARYIELEDGSFYADIFLCPGVWATGDTVEECRDELQDALLEWLIAAYEDQDPLPEMTELAWLNPLWHSASD